MQSRNISLTQSAAERKQFVGCRKLPNRSLVPTRNDVHFGPGRHWLLRASKTQTRRPFADGRSLAASNRTADIIARLPAVLSRTRPFLGRRKHAALHQRQSRSKTR